MNFIDYVIAKTDKYNNIGGDKATKPFLLTLQVLNYRARRMRDELAKENDQLQTFLECILDLDTELDEGHFDRIIIDPNKESGK